MNENIEIKAEINNIDIIKSYAEKLAQTKSKIISQKDIYYNCLNGRIKLRILSEKNGKLIFYNRPDQLGPKSSTFTVSETNEPDKLHRVFAEAYGVIGIVNKLRTIIIFDNVRIHLDEVEGLGNFLELEMDLAGVESKNRGIELVEQLMNQLQIDRESLISCSYLDLLMNKKNAKLG